MRSIPAGGVVMAAGVMRDARSPGLIETAGIELDRTLLAYDYLNGEPLSALEARSPTPSGHRERRPPSTARRSSRSGASTRGSSLTWRTSTSSCGCGAMAAGCRLAKDARGVHEHSATLGPGSPRKDYLAGFGRGYLLRKWSVVSARRLPAVLLREIGQAAVQSAMDRNLGPVRGRVNGLRAGRPSESYPSPEVLGSPPSLWSTVRRRWRRRARLRRKAA